MKLTYLIDDNISHYIEFRLDEGLGELTGTYVKDGMSIFHNSVDAYDVLSMNPERNPEIQIAKKGYVWDFHIMKTDDFGVVHRKSLGLLVGEDLHASRVKLKNDTSESRTLKNYITHYLAVYDSPLTIAYYPFESMTGVTGVSSSAIGVIEYTDGQLKIGYEANVSLELLGEASVNANELPFELLMKITRLGANDVTSQHPIEFQLGDNRFKIDPAKGITLESPVSLDAQVILAADKLPVAPFTIKLAIDGVEAVCYIAGQRIVLTNYNHDTLIDRIRLYGFGNTDDYSLVDFVHMRATHNYRADSTPPAITTGLTAIAGERQAFLRWDPNTEDDLAGYRVYVNNELHSIGLVTTNEYTANDLPDGVPARISVVAVDKSGNAAPSTQVIEIVPVSDASKEVSGVDIFVNNMGVHFSWIPPVYEELNGIKIYRINVADKTRVEFTTLPKTDTQVIEYPSPPAGRYIYQIVTVDIHNNETSGVQIFQSIT
jgi:hypothetical protein